MVRSMAMLKVGRFALVALLAASALALPAQTPEKTPEVSVLAADPRLEQLLTRMDQVQKDMTTLRVSFVQTNTFRMLSQPQVMKGHLVLRKPDTALYEYTTPSKLFFLVKDGDLLVYNPAKKNVVVQDIRRHQSRIVRYLGIGQPLRELQGSFKVSWVGQEGGLVHLSLTPTKAKLRRKIAALNFWVDQQTAFLSGFEVVEAEGDRIRFDFSQWETNPALTEASFKVDIPAGVKVHRQMLDMQEPFQR